MQIHLRTMDSQFKIGDASQAVGDCWLSFRVLRRVADDNHVASQSLGDFRQFRFEYFATLFLLAFDQEFDLEREFFPASFPCKDTQHVGEHLTFVVGRPTSVDIAIANLRGEGRGFPQVDWIGGLDVVMSVDQDDRFTWYWIGFGVDQSRSITGNHFCFQTSVSESVSHPVGSPIHIRGLGAIGRNTWDSQQFKELLEMLLAVAGQKIIEFGKICHVCPRKKRTSLKIEHPTPFRIYRISQGLCPLVSVLGISNEEH